MNKNVKILLVYQNEFPRLSDLYVPIHVGKGESDGLRDDVGDNISDKNSTYNELTAIYWAWKNYEKLGSPDYLGLAHYRRFLIFKDKKYPYYECKAKDIVKNSFCDNENVSRFLDSFDALAPRPSKRKSVEYNYVLAHHQEDVVLLKEIIKETRPDYMDITNAYLQSKGAYYFNMFVFSKDLFFDYCRWIFPVLQEFEKRTANPTERLFISEILTGIYLYDLKEKNYLKELPVLFVVGKKQKLSQAIKDTKINFKEKRSSFFYNLRPLIFWLVPRKLLLIRRRKILK